MFQFSYQSCIVDSCPKYWSITTGLERRIFRTFNEVEPFFWLERFQNHNSKRKPIHLKKNTHTHTLWPTITLFSSQSSLKKKGLGFFFLPKIVNKTKKEGGWVWRGREGGKAGQWQLMRTRCPTFTGSHILLSFGRRLIRTWTQVGGNAGTALPCNQRNTWGQNKLEKWRRMC